MRWASGASRGGVIRRVTPGFPWLGKPPFRDEEDAEEFRTSALATLGKSPPAPLYKRGENPATAANLVGLATRIFPPLEKGGEGGFKTSALATLDKSPPAPLYQRGENSPAEGTALLTPHSSPLTNK